MPSKKPQISLRLDEADNYKLKYIADDSFRTQNAVLTMLVKEYIAKYEAEHGPIKIELEE